VASMWVHIIHIIHNSPKSRSSHRSCIYGGDPPTINSDAYLPPQLESLHTLKTLVQIPLECQTSGPQKSPATCPPHMETSSLDTWIPTCSRRDTHIPSIEWTERGPEGSIDPWSTLLRYSDLRGFDVTTPLSSRSGQHWADYIIDPTVGIVPGHPQIYDPD
jgi:hypothetical protein